MLGLCVRHATDPRWNSREAATRQRHLRISTERQKSGTAHTSHEPFRDQDLLECVLMFASCDSRLEARSHVEDQVSAGTTISAAHMQPSCSRTRSSFGIVSPQLPTAQLSVPAAFATPAPECKTRHGHVRIPWQTRPAGHTGAANGRRLSEARDALTSPPALCHAVTRAEAK